MDIVGGLFLILLNNSGTLCLTRLIAATRRNVRVDRPVAAALMGSIRKPVTEQYPKVFHSMRRSGVERTPREFFSVKPNRWAKSVHAWKQIPQRIVPRAPFVPVKRLVIFCVDRTAELAPTRDWKADNGVRRIIG
ncbi:MAG: hypothetical protein ACXWWP_12765 [Candidatus Binatia bacterium]